MNRGTPLSCLLRNPLVSLIVFKYGTAHVHEEVVYALQASIIFVLLEQEEQKSRPSCHFVPKDQNKLCAHDKNWKHAGLGCSKDG